MTPIFSLSVLLASFSFAARSSRKSFSAGSFQSWPYWLWRNASRSALTSVTLTRKTVESGRTRSGGAAAWARFAVSPDKTTQSKPSNEGQAKNRPLRHTHHLTLHSRHSAAHRPRELETRRRRTTAGDRRSRRQAPSLARRRR